MRISDDETRALAFIAALIALTTLGRWVDRPRTVLPEGAEVDIAALAARSEAARKQTPQPARGKGASPNRPAPQPTDVVHVVSPAAESTVEKEAAPISSRNPLDLNRASAAELDKLPGVGPALAARIIGRRDSVGPFRTFEQLDSVRGIGPALLARLKPLLRLAR